MHKISSTASRKFKYIGYLYAVCENSYYRPKVRTNKILFVFRLHVKKKKKNPKIYTMVRPPIQVGHWIGGQYFINIIN